MALLWNTRGFYFFYFCFKDIVDVIGSYFTSFFQYISYWGNFSIDISIRIIIMIGVNHDSRLLDIEEIGLLYQKVCNFVIPELLHIY